MHLSQSDEGSSSLLHPSSSVRLMNLMISMRGMLSSRMKIFWKIVEFSNKDITLRKRTLCVEDNTIWLGLRLHAVFESLIINSIPYSVSRKKVINNTTWNYFSELNHSRLSLAWVLCFTSHAFHSLRKFWWLCSQDGHKRVDGGQCWWWWFTIFPRIFFALLIWDDLSADGGGSSSGNESK